jgi:hypothetical protein
MRHLDLLVQRSLPGGHRHWLYPFEHSNYSLASVEVKRSREKGLTDIQDGDIFLDVLFALWISSHQFVERPTQHLDEEKGEEGDPSRRWQCPFIFFNCSNSAVETVGGLFCVCVADECGDIGRVLFGL